MGDVLIKIEVSDVSMIVVTSVLVTILALVLVIGVCFKLAGHKFTWEKHAQLDDELPLDYNYRMSDYDEDMTSR